MNCIFCKIVEGSISSQKVYEDANVVAFKDIHPQAPVHVLVVPKTHVDNLLNADSSVLQQLFVAVQKTAKEFGVEKTGFRTVINTGAHGGQTVFHLHLHILGGSQLGGSMAGKPS